MSVRGRGNKVGGHSGMGPGPEKGENKKKFGFSGHLPGYFVSLPVYGFGH